MTATEFKSVILPAYGAMTAVARKLLGDRQSAEDAVQDVMRSLWEGRENIIVNGAGAAYAVRSVRNRCLDILRRKPADTDTPIENVADTIADDDCDDTQRLERLSAAIDNLGEPRRTILRLSLAGKSGAEIAATVNLSETNVRQHLSRSRKELRKLIMQYENDERLN